MIWREWWPRCCPKKQVETYSSQSAGAAAVSEPGRPRGVGGTGLGGLPCRLWVDVRWFWVEA